MKSGTRTVVGVWALCAVLALAGEDVDKMKAPDLLNKAAANLAAKEGYHFQADTQAMGQEVGVEGVHLKPDTWYFKGNPGIEVYLKGKKALANNPANGQWVDPKDLDPMAEAAVGMVQTLTPGAILGNMLRNAKAAKLLGDEKVGETDCKVVEVPGSQDDVKRFLDEQAKRVPMLKGANASAMFDLKKSTSAYKAWIGRDDLLPRRLETRIHVEPKQGSPVPIPAMDQTLKVELSKFGEELDLSAPEEVRKKLGLK